MKGWQKEVALHLHYNGPFFFLQWFHPQDIKGQCWTDEESDGENESEQFLYGIQVKGLF